MTVHLDSTSPGTGPNVRLRVVLVEDKPDVRESWARLIDSFSDFECVGVCVSGEEALRVMPELKPQVVLMDIFLPRMSGVECTARLKELLPGIRVVMLTAVDDDEMVFLALEAGADGYLLKRTKPEDLRAALLDVLSGGAPMTSEIARRVISRFRSMRPPDPDDARLSPQELRLLASLAEGASYAESATALGVSVNTVRTHIRSIYDKLHVHSKSAAVSKALRSGLI